jgi:hypothetical protein
MTTSQLVYHYNPKTDLPMLEDLTAEVGPAELSAWEAELNRRATQQSLGEGELITFSSRVRNLPVRYRIRTEPGPSSRYPTFHLDPVTSPSAMLRSSRPGQQPDTWQEGLKTELEQLIGQLQADRTGRHGLEFVLEELGDLMNKHPDQAGLALLAAFTAAGQLSCARSEAQLRQEQFYALALEALDPLLHQQVQEARAARPAELGRVLGFLARLLGRPGTEH